MSVRIPAEVIRVMLVGVRARLEAAGQLPPDVAQQLDTAIEWLSPKPPLQRTERPYPSHERWRRIRLLVFGRDGWVCLYCGKPVDERTGHADHVIPRSRGGSDDPANLVAARGPCNISKGARTPEEWRALW